MTDTPTAFVLIPFEPEFDRLYSQLILPALQDAGYEVRKADSLLNQQNVLQDILRGIGGAKLVVAELTSLNPNVLYELGLAHGLGVPTVLLAQSVEQVPFDLRSYRIVEYSPRFDEIHELRNALTSIGEKHLGGEVEFGSPVSDFLPGGAPAGMGSSTEIDADADDRAATEEEEQAGFLDQLTELEEVGEQMEAIAARISRATEDVGEDMQRGTERIEKLGSLESPGGVRQAQSVAKTAASDLTRYAERLEDDLPNLEAVVDAMVSSGLGFVTGLDVDSPESREQLPEFRDSLKELLDGMLETLGNTREFRNIVAGFAGVSRELDRASRRVVKALDRMIGLFERTESFARNGIELIEGKLGGSEQEQNG